MGISTVPAIIEHVDEEDTGTEQKDNPVKFWRKEERHLKI